MVQSYELIKWKEKRLHVCDGDREGKTDDSVSNLVPFQIPYKFTGYVTLLVKVWEGEWVDKIFCSAFTKTMAIRK